MMPQPPRFDSIVRSERYFTATLLPAILFHDDLRGLRAFLHLVDGKIASEHDCTGAQLLRPPAASTFSPGSVEIITEFHIRRDLTHAGLLPDKVAPSEDDETRDAPDVVIFLDGEFVVLEAKFFERRMLARLNEQLRSQRRQIRHIFEVRPQVRAYRHIALLPRAFGPLDCDGIITWAEVATLAAGVLGEGHYVTQRLLASLAYYEHRRGLQRGGTEGRQVDEEFIPNYDGKLSLAEVLEKCRRQGDRIEIGHMGGERDLARRDWGYLQTKQWKWRRPATNRGVTERANWIPGSRFVQVVEEVRARAGRG